MPELELHDTPFRLAVWHILQQIPYGEVITYKEIAQEIARQRNCGNMSAQAIGGAVGHNPISILIPCHRVIGSNGSLTGYAGGVSRNESARAGRSQQTSRLLRIQIHACCTYAEICSRTGSLSAITILTGIYIVFGTGNISTVGTSLCRTGIFAILVIQKSPL